MKENNKKIIIRGFILFVILCAVFYGLNDICRIAVLNERYEIIKQIDYMPQNSVDVMIVGNSHAQEGINSRLMSEALGAKVLNFSFSQQQTATAYYFLKKNLEKQSPKVVLLEAYTLIQPVQGGYEFIPLNFSKIKHLIMLHDEGDIIDSFFPVARNHNFWASAQPFKPLLQNVHAGKVEVPPFFSALVMSDLAVERHTFYDSRKLANKIRDYRIEHLSMIKELCEENGAQLIITMLPLYKTMVERIDYDGLYYDRIIRFCQENDILYYDFNKESPTDWTYKYFREQDYTQNTHLNSYGQTLASTELAGYIAGATDYFTLKSFGSPEIPITDFLDTISPSNSLLIIDDCPKPINKKINPGIAERLENMGVQLATHEKDEDEDPAVYLISNGMLVSGYTLPDSFEYDEDAVTFCELDSFGTIKKRAAARWDQFDTAIIR